VIGLTLAIVLCLSGWAANEWCWLRQEQNGIAILQRDYHAMAMADLVSIATSDWMPGIDLGELQRGRLYVPVRSVSFYHRGTVIDRLAWEQIAHFRYLDDIGFQDCRLAPATKFRFADPGSVIKLKLCGTPITIDTMYSISQLSHLKNLWLDGTGLKGDWLQPISNLSEIESLIVDNADLSDGAVDSLARMKRLVWLQLPHAKIDAKLGPALAGLEKLECLVLSNTTFDDDGLKRLIVLKRLKVLCLGGTAITDAGMESVAKLPNLSRLSIDSTKVGDVGLQQLSHLHKLAGLTVRRTHATNSCLRVLAAMPSLKIALVGDTRISSTVQGFVGVLDDDCWYPNDARVKEAVEDSK
jgi:hypothetical protein